MRRLTMVCCVSVLAVVAVGCGGGAEQVRPTEQVQVISPATEPAPTTEGAVALPMVEVSPDGAGFEPPVQVAQLPNGVWYCDMGTVHYARAEAGDGTCPKCGMKLVQKVTATGEPAPEPEPATQG